MAHKQPLFIDIGSGISMRVGFPTIESWDNKNRPQNPQKGTMGFNQETENLEYWDGVDWYTTQMDKI